MDLKSISLFVLILVMPMGAYAADAKAAQDLSIGEILERIEAIYTATEFSANFIQASTIKAMDITDSASGKLYIKYPGKMRWEYQKPETQIIVTDGNQLWMYRPADNQVMLGKASAFFSEGKGAGFLSDIRLLRNDFDIILEDIRFGDYFNLKLVPREQNWDIAYVHLLVSRKTFHIAQVFTYNAYEDVTRIELVDLKFNQTFGKNFFKFDMPVGVDVLRMDESP